MLLCATVSLSANIDNSAYFRRQKNFICNYTYIVRLPGGPVVKNPLANAGDPGDDGLIPGSGRFPGEGMTTYSSILDWKIPRMWESGRLQSMGHKELDTTNCAHTHTHAHTHTCTHALIHTYKYSKVLSIKTLNYSQGM